jgi:hypothetical protein
MRDLSLIVAMSFSAAITVTSCALLLEKRGIDRIVFLLVAISNSLLVGWGFWLLR